MQIYLDIPVSSNIAKVTWDDETNELFVWFMTRETSAESKYYYRYCNVTKEIVDQLADEANKPNGSIGKVLRQLVSSKPGEFPYEKLQETEDTVQ